MKKLKKAVALKYDTNRQKAPVIAAKGKGETAQRIIKIANENDIPIKEDKDLVEMLSHIELNKEIPPNLYQAVAEVFSFIYTHTKR
jgi:flagellar biosynthesis protein